MVYISSSLAMSRGQMKSPQAFLKAKIAKAAIADLDRGIIICQ